jgi:hypothetical protein
VRQFGNLSFSRIFDAGHLVPFYQPETAFTVFSRIIQGDDISLGRNIDLSTYKTEGITDSSKHINVVPPEPAPVCWIREASSTCTDEQQKAIARGEGVVENGIWNPKAVSAPQVPPRSSTSSRIAETKARTTTVPLTGVYTATATPTPVATTKAKSGVQPLRVNHWNLLRRYGDANRHAGCAWRQLSGHVLVTVSAVLLVN